MGSKVIAKGVGKSKILCRVKQLKGVSSVSEIATLFKKVETSQTSSSKYSQPRTRRWSRPFMINFIQHRLPVLLHSGPIPGRKKASIPGAKPETGSRRDSMGEKARKKPGRRRRDAGKKVTKIRKHFIKSICSNPTGGIVFAMQKNTPSPESSTPPPHSRAREGPFWSECLPSKGYSDRALRS